MRLHNQALAGDQLADGWRTEQTDVGVPDSETGRTVLVSQLDVPAIGICAGREHRDADGCDCNFGPSS